MVLTVSTDVPEAPGTEAGLNTHVGARVAAGRTLQVKPTAPANPLTGAMVIVEVEEAPAETVAGVSVEAARVKSAGGAAVTVTVTGAE